MEDIRRAAKAAYENFTEEEKREMESEFRSMDKDGDGKIDHHEFLAHSDQHTQSFFNLLDQNHDGVLDFDELKTLGYIISSGRPFCAACKEFIPAALFFTCTQCRLASTTEANTFNLCIRCYQGQSFEHEHTDFVDSTRLPKLQTRRSSRAKPSRSAQSSSKTKPSPIWPIPSETSNENESGNEEDITENWGIGVWCSGCNRDSPILEFHHARQHRGEGVGGDDDKTGGEGVGGDDDYYDEDYDDAAADADDPSHF